jgi:hypothetical protein
VSGIKALDDISVVSVPNLINLVESGQEFFLAYEENNILTAYEGTGLGFYVGGNLHGDSVSSFFRIDRKLIDTVEWEPGQVPFLLIRTSLLDNCHFLPVDKIQGWTLKRAYPDLSIVGYLERFKRLSATPAPEEEI